MELKYVFQHEATFRRNLLIVPYGIEIEELNCLLRQYGSFNRTLWN